MVEATGLARGRPEADASAAAATPDAGAAVRGRRRVDWPPDGPAAADAASGAGGGNRRREDMRVVRGCARLLRVLARARRRVLVPRVLRRCRRGEAAAAVARRVTVRAVRMMRVAHVIVDDAPVEDGLDLAIGRLLGQATERTVRGGRLLEDGEIFRGHEEAQDGEAGPDGEADDEAQARQAAW